MPLIESLNSKGQPEHPLEDWLFCKEEAKQKSVSPAASFSATSAASGGEAFQSATSPSQQLKKRKIILDEWSLGQFRFNGDRAAFIHRLRVAGFEVYLCGVGKIENLEGIDEKLKMVKEFDPAVDYEGFKISKDESVWLTPARMQEVVNCFLLDTQQARTKSQARNEDMGEDDFLDMVFMPMHSEIDADQKEEFKHRIAEQKERKKLEFRLIQELRDLSKITNDVAEGMIKRYDKGAADFIDLVIKHRPDLITADFLNLKVFPNEQWLILKFKPDLLPEFFEKNKDRIGDNSFLLRSCLDINPLIFNKQKLFLGGLSKGIYSEVAWSNPEFFKRNFSRPFSCTGGMYFQAFPNYLINEVSEQNLNNTCLNLNDFVNPDGSSEALFASFNKKISEGFFQEVVVVKGFFTGSGEQPIKEDLFVTLSEFLLQFKKLKYAILPKTFSALKLPDGVIRETLEENRTIFFHSSPPQQSYSGSKIFITKGISAVKTATDGKEPEFEMQRSGEVLNGNSDGLRMRYAMEEYNLEALSVASGSFKNSAIVSLSKLSEEDVQNFRKPNSKTYFSFTQSLPIGMARLLSFSAQENLEGVVGDISNLTIIKGDDGFFYASSEVEREITYVVSDEINLEKESLNYQNIPINIKSIIDDYRSGTFSPSSKPDLELSKTDLESSSEWLERIYKSKRGSCEWRVMAVLHQLQKAGVDESSYRAVNIDNNHVIIEVKSSNGAWVKVDLGGEEAQLKYDPKDLDGQQVSGRKTFSAEPKPSPAASEMLQRLRQSSGIVECKTQEVLLEKTNSGKRILIAAGSNLQNHAIFLLKSARQNQRSTFYINSIEDVEAIGQRRVFIGADGTPTLSNKSELEIFLAAVAAQDAEAASSSNTPQLLINWDALKPSHKVTLNTILDQSRAIHGIKIPDSIQIISLCAAAPDDDSFLSRHDVKIKSEQDLEIPRSAVAIFEVKSFDASASATPELEAKEDSSIPTQTTTHAIDLQGFSDWKKHLFGDVKLNAKKLEWRDSEFRNLCQQHDEEFWKDDSLKKKADSVIFEIFNTSNQDAKEIEAFFALGRAQGYVTYLGRRINLPESFEIKCSRKAFDFSKFTAQSESGDLKISANSSVQNIPQNTQLINAYLFDKLLQNKEVGDGLYFERPGLLEVSKGQNLNLFIFQTLQMANGIACLTKRKKYGIKLSLYVAEGVELPAAFKEKVSVVKIESPAETIQKSLPKIIASNNPNAALKEILARSASNAAAWEEQKSAPEESPILILNVEDYSYQDLISRTTFESDAQGFSNFAERKSNLLQELETQLQLGKKIVLKGEFSDDLLQMLHPLLAGMPPFEGIGKNLTIIVEDKSITSTSTTCKALNWLGKDGVGYGIIPASTQQISRDPNLDYREEKPIAAVNLENSAAESAAFITQRKEKFKESLSKSSMLQMVGPSGVGKSGLIKLFEKEEQATTKVYRELSHFKDWANDKSEKIKILFIDESNIEDLHLTMFEPLKPGGNRKILYKGEIFELSPNHKVVFACNPLEFGGGRVAQKLFEDQSIPAMHLEDFSAAYVYEKILKESIYEKLGDVVKERISIESFKEESQKLIANYLRENASRKSGEEVMTVRELQEQALQFLSQEFEKAIEGQTPERKPISTENFIETSATADNILAIG